MMVNTTSLSVVAATLNFANIPTLIRMTTTTLATPTLATVMSTISSPNTPILPTVSILTALGSLQTHSSKPVQNTQGDCRPQAPGHGPIPEKDNMSSFYTSPVIRTPSLDAPTPYGYTLAFRGANASYVGTNYLGYHELEAYNPNECASRCLRWGTSASDDAPEASSTTLFPEGFEFSATPTSTSTPTPTPTPRAHVCNSFNIYFERSPSINLGEECQNADSRTIVKCALWGEGDMRGEGATNTGYRTWDFQVVIAGSNGYVLGVEEEVMSSEGEKSVKLDVAAALVERFVVGAALAFLIAVHMGF